MAKLGGVDVDLHDLGVGVEAVSILDHPVQPRTDDQHEVGLAHGGASRGLERNGVVLGHQSAGHRGRVEGGRGQVYQLSQLVGGAGEERSATGEDHRALSGGEHVDGLSDYAGLSGRPGAPLGAPRSYRVFLVDFFVEHIRAAVDVDRSGASGRGLAESHADDLGVARGLGGLVDPLHHRLHDADLVDLLERLASYLVDRARAA